MSDTRIQRLPSRAASTGQRFWRVALTLILALSVVALGGIFTTSPAGAATKAKQKPLSEPNLTLAFANGVSLSILVHEAVVQGYFKQYGLNVTLATITTGPAQLAGIAGGSVTVAQSGPSTTLVPIQNGQAKVQFFASASAGIPYQMLISKSWAKAHGITQKSNPNQVIPKLAGASMGGVTGPTDSVATILGYVLKQYHVTTTTSYLGSTAAEAASWSVGRVDAYLSTDGSAAALQQQFGGVIVNLESLSKIPLVTNSFPAAYAASTSFIQQHPDTLIAFTKALWRAWQYLSVPANKTAIESYMQSLYPNTPDAQMQYLIQFTAASGIWLSKAIYSNSVALANTTLKPPLTVSYSTGVNSKIEKAAVKALGITPPHNGPA
jgi:ABC-type nitrate/sulfonate/bicarbonate transport system substrate-binding protein